MGQSTSAHHSGSGAEEAGTPAGRAGLPPPHSLVARLLEERGHASWDTVEGFYVRRLIGLFPATLVDSLRGQGGLGYDERCDPKTQWRERKHTLH